MDPNPFINLSEAEIQELKRQPPMMSSLSGIKSINSLNYLPKDDPPIMDSFVQDMRKAADEIVPPHQKIVGNENYGATQASSPPSEKPLEKHLGQQKTSKEEQSFAEPKPNSKPKREDFCSIERELEQEKITNQFQGMSLDPKPTDQNSELVCPEKCSFHPSLPRYNLGRKTKSEIRTLIKVKFMFHGFEDGKCLFLKYWTGRLPYTTPFEALAVFLARRKEHPWHYRGYHFFYTSWWDGERTKINQSSKLKVLYDLEHREVEDGPHTFELECQIDMPPEPKPKPRPKPKFKPVGKTLYVDDIPKYKDSLVEEYEMRYLTNFV